MAEHICVWSMRVFVLSLNKACDTFVWSQLVTGTHLKEPGLLSHKAYAQIRVHTLMDTQTHTHTHAQRLRQWTNLFSQCTSQCKVSEVILKSRCHVAACAESRQRKKFHTKKGGKGGRKRGVGPGKRGGREWKCEDERRCGVGVGKEDEDCRFFFRDYLTQHQWHM